MSQAPESHGHDPEITKTLADFTMGLKYEDLSEEAIEAAKHCLLDWIGVTVAGLEEPLTHMLIEFRNCITTVMNNFHVRRLPLTESPPR